MAETRTSGGKGRCIDATVLRASKSLNDVFKAPPVTSAR